MSQTQATGISEIEVPPEHHITTRLWMREIAMPNTVILRYPDGGTWHDVTWGELARRVRAVAGGLIALGIKHGDRVVLMSQTRLEWTVADLAILAAGGVTVPVYETSSVSQCSWILADSGAVAAIASAPEHAKKLDEARGEAPDLGEVFVIDDGGLEALAERGDDASRAAVESMDIQIHGDDLASIIYTSGTTGRPKGCKLTHRNILWNARQTGMNLAEVFGPGDSTLLFLPLAHVFARLIQIGCLETATVMGYNRSIPELSEDINSFQPTFLLSVPRVFEKVFNTAQRKAEGPKAKVFDFAVATAQEWSDPTKGNLLTGAKHLVADKLVYSKLRAALGGRMRNCISGGAPLAPHLAHFFNAAGITIYEGYGLTETSAPVSVNTPDAFKIGTVGRPNPGTEIRIAADGEIQSRGDQTFLGYWQNEAASAEVLLDDGWFATGDIGEIDDDGYVSITGRKKELIVTAGGKNVAPAVLEEGLKSNRLVSQVMVVGDNRPFIGALVTLEPEELAAFAKAKGLAGTTAAELCTDATVMAEIQRGVDHANAEVSKAESIRKIIILERDFTEEDGEMTPSLKVKRPVVAEHFADRIEELYGD